MGIWYSSSALLVQIIKWGLLYDTHIFILVRWVLIMEKYANATKRVTVFVDSTLFHLCEYIYAANKTVFGIHHPVPMLSLLSYHCRIVTGSKTSTGAIEMLLRIEWSRVQTRDEREESNGGNTNFNLHSLTVLNGKSMAAEQRNRTKLNLQATEERTQQLSDLNYNKMFCSGPPKAPKPHENE